MRSRLPRPGTNQLEIERLRREVTKLKAERNNLKRPQPTSRGCRRDVRLHREAPGSWPTMWRYEALGVSRGGFSAWLTRPRSQRVYRDEMWGDKILASFLQNPRTYGTRHVRHDLLAEGDGCGMPRIEQLMRRQAWRAHSRQRQMPVDAGPQSPRAVTPNVRNRQVDATAPNRVTDFTSHLNGRREALPRGGRGSLPPTSGGWSMNATMTAQ